MINNSGRHLLALINDILDLSRIEAGHMEVRADEIDVAGFLTELVASVGPAAHDKGLELKLEVADPAPKLISDRTKVHQILLNLVGNAIKFTDAGSIVVSGSQPSAHLVAFTVTDTGPGIALSERVRIFGEFERGTGQAPNVEGTGLGLAISRGLAGALGGAIVLESEVGRGSTFTLTLPTRGRER
jgi:signal transduction histidine kinase